MKKKTLGTGMLVVTCPSLLQVQNARKHAVMEERRAHAQDIFDELKEQHGSGYSGPQYRLWAEAIVSESHDSRSNPAQW